MNFQTLLHLYPGIFYVFLFLMALCIGSFLNVVIYRLPLMVFRSYKEDYESFETQFKSITLPTGVFNLSVPRSHCPHCAAPIEASSNIPLLSFVLQSGKCKHCHTPISSRYPLVEVLTAFCSVITIWLLGANAVGAVSLLFVWSLIALTFIDFDYQILPDDITMPLLWLGLLFNLGDFFVPISDAVIGAIVGYMSLYVVYQAFKLLTGKEGMGFGDFKLLAAIGAWLGWQQLLIVIIISASLGTFLGLFLILTKKLARGEPLPFGPFLALGAIIALWVGKPLLQSYLMWMV